MLQHSVTQMKMVNFVSFCLFLSRHRSARHSAGTYRLQCACVSNGSRELHHSYIYGSEHVFIALRWRSEMIMGFHEYTYQDREY